MQARPFVHHCTMLKSTYWYTFLEYNFHNLHNNSFDQEVEFQAQPRIHFFEQQHQQLHHLLKTKNTAQHFVGKIIKLPRKPNIAKSMAKIHDQKLQQQLSQHESHCPQAEQSSDSSLLSLIGSLNIVEYKLSRLFAKCCLAYS